MLSVFDCLQALVEHLRPVPHRVFERAFERRNLLPRLHLRRRRAAAGRAGDCAPTEVAADKTRPTRQPSSELRSLHSP